MKPIIEVSHLTKEFRLGEYIEYGSLRDTLSSLFKRKTAKAKDTFKALNDLNFQIEQGEAVGIIGRNGAGKSTLLKILSRITPPSSGEVILRGTVASLLEVGTGFHSELTGRENIFFNASLLGLEKSQVKSQFDSIVDFAGVEKFIDTPLKRYSSGMYVRLAFAVAAHLEPDILIVDEVLAVGDLAFQKKCLGKMDDVRKQGRTVIFVSHQMEMIEKLCSRAILMENGSVVQEGDVQTLVESYIKSNENSTSKMSFDSIRKPFSDIYFTRLETLDHNGGSKEVVRAGRACTFRLFYDCPVDVDNFAFWLIVFDQRYTPVAEFFTGSLKDHVYRPDVNKGFVDIAVEELNLRPGTYIIDLSIHQRGQVKDHVVRAATFDVGFEDFYGSGALPASGVLMKYKIT